MIVAEISASHDGSFEKAVKLVNSAAHAGATAVKFQTYEPELIAAKGCTIMKGPWEGWDLQELYKKGHTPKEWHKDLFQLAKEHKITPFSTPFHQSDVDFLESIDCPIYKISSFDIINTPLVQYAASTNKPLIISTGMATMEEIADAVEAVDKTQNSSSLTLLHCISAYPAKEFYIETMKDLMEYFHVKVGISDHTQSPVAAIAATALGAECIEKHICLDRDGLDGGFALLPEEFRWHVDMINETKDSLGVRYGPKPGEECSYVLRPSLRYNTDLSSKTAIEPHHLHISRPSDGVAPFYYHQVIGQKVTKTVKKDEPVRLYDLHNDKIPIAVKRIDWTIIFKDLEKAGQIDSRIKEALGVPWSTYKYYRDTEDYEPKYSTAQALLKLHTIYCGEELTRQRIEEAE